MTQKAILNNGKIVFTFAEARGLGICKSTFAQALVKLDERGLVVRNEEHLDGIPNGIPVPRHYYVNVLDGRGRAEGWVTWAPKAAKGRKLGNHHNLSQFTPGKALAEQLASKRRASR